ncbi:hypothetical protein TorRG33x02_111500 [Trema orientale]|uniref:Uncharacterized protein n=1 Tax=Trema orientale TaxID=63057 RepID=A0A2P5F633_TREOI|nr:hypothetical protein TorRG33x02_111500 [Trema orientale]
MALADTLVMGEERYHGILKEKYGDHNAAAPMFGGREERYQGIPKEKHEDHKAAPMFSVREERYHGNPKEKHEDHKAAPMSSVREEYYHGPKKHDDHKAPRVVNHREMLRYFERFGELSPNRYFKHHQPRLTHDYPQSHFGHKEPYYVVPNKGPLMGVRTAQYHRGDQNYPQAADHMVRSSQVGRQVRKKQGGAVDSNIDEAAKLLPGEVSTDYGRRYKFPVNFNDRKNEVPIEFVDD